jgi:hypothetical protein
MNDVLKKKRKSLNEWLIALKNLGPKRIDFFFNYYYIYIYIFQIFQLAFV